MDQQAMPSRRWVERVLLRVECAERALTLLLLRWDRQWQEPVESTLHCEGCAAQSVRRRRVRR